MTDTCNSLCAFLDKLHENLSKSLLSFNSIKKTLPVDKKNIADDTLDYLASKIEKVNDEIEKYRKSILELEDKYFYDDEHQFVLSFNTDEKEELASPNYIDSYKKSINSQIIKHKYSDVLMLGLSNQKKVKNVISNESKNTNEIILNKIEDVDLQSNVLKLPVIKNLQDMPSAFYWFEGDQFYKKGIYTSLCKNFYVKVPFPNLINASKDYKLKSIRCKYATLQECQANKKKISSIYNTDVKECFYVHKKEKFNKVGSQYRCALETFGNHEILDNDLEKVSHFDIKHILMYSLSDDLLAILWYQNKFKDSKELVFTNLDIY